MSSVWMDKEGHVVASDIKLHVNLFSSDPNRPVLCARYAHISQIWLFYLDFLFFLIFFVCLPVIGCFSNYKCVPVSVHLQIGTLF